MPGKGFSLAVSSRSKRTISRISARWSQDNCLAHPELYFRLTTDEMEVRAAGTRCRIGSLGHGPRTVTCNGRPLAFDREPHPYRTGGVVIPMDVLRERLRDGSNDIEIEVS